MKAVWLVAGLLLTTLSHAGGLLGDTGRASGNVGGSIGRPASGPGSTEVGRGERSDADKLSSYEDAAKSGRNVQPNRKETSVCITAYGSCPITKEALRNTRCFCDSNTGRVFGVTQ
jgi:hypothetical protein